jgi:DNA-binding transcriptional regulator YiaG
MTDYSSLIKKIREQLLVSQTELAQMLGVSFATVNRWEKSHHQPNYLQRRKIQSICRKHKIPFENK